MAYVTPGFFRRILEGVVLTVTVLGVAWLVLAFLAALGMNLLPWSIEGPQKHMIRLDSIIGSIDSEARKGLPRCSPFIREEFQMGPFAEVFDPYFEGGSCAHPSGEVLKSFSKDYHTKRKKDFIVALKGEKILLISVGPDGVLSVGEDEMRELFEDPPEEESTEPLSRDEKREEFLSKLEPYVYRVTNGTGSNGDIFRLLTPRE